MVSAPPDEEPTFAISSGHTAKVPRWRKPDRKRNRLSDCENWENFQENSENARKAGCGQGDLANSDSMSEHSFFAAIDPINNHAKASTKRKALIRKRSRNDADSSTCLVRLRNGRVHPVPLKQKRPL